MTSTLAEHDSDVSARAAEATRSSPQNTSDEVEYPYLLRGVDPRDLIQEGNTRVVGDVRETRPDLVASIAEHGVDPKVSIISVVRRTEDGGLVVLVGFHRTASAVSVKELENPDLKIVVLVHAPGTTRQEVLIAQGIENSHREGYTQAEEGHLYEQLSLGGLDDDEISRQLTRPVERVRAGRAVAASPLTHAVSEALPGADLLSLAMLTEFADDEADHRKLVRVLAERPYHLGFEVAQVRRKRDMRAKKTEEQQQLAAQGYGIVEDEFNLPEGTARLDELCSGEDENPLERDAHTGCPGRAVVVDVDDDLEVAHIEFCANFAEHGHHSILSVKLRAAEAQLRADGVPIVDSEAADLTLLRDLFADEQAERAITPTEHAGCPGHAAYATEDPLDLSVDVVHVCTDPSGHGHVLRGARNTKTEHSAAFRLAELDRTRKNNAAWRKRKSHRRKWLLDFFAGWRTWKQPTAAKQKGKTATHKQMLPPRVHHLLALAPVLAADFLAEAAPAHNYACTLLKLDQPAGNKRDTNPIAVYLRKKTTSETQALLIRLAQVIGAGEQHWDYAYTDKNADASWRDPSADTRFYFELLEALGYPLDHVEKLINNPELDIEKWPHLAPEPVGETAVADIPDTDAAA